jgi:hypothetical protein
MNESLSDDGDDDSDNKESRNRRDVEGSSGLLMMSDLQREKGYN